MLLDVNTEGLVKELDVSRMFGSCMLKHAADDKRRLGVFTPLQGAKRFLVEDDVFAVLKIYVYENKYSHSYNRETCEVHIILVNGQVGKFSFRGSPDDCVNYLLSIRSDNET